MHSRLVKGLTVLGTLACAIGAAAQAPSTHASLNGVWELAISDADARARLERGIGRAVSDMPPLVDMIAAGRLRERVQIPRRIVIRTSDTQITVRMDDRAYTTRPGVPVDSVASGGEPMRITQFFRGHDLRQAFRTANGSKFNTYVVQGDTMRFDAVVASPRLPHEVRFSVPFRRVR